ncbi:alpha/beta hydrolase [Phanerochaete sordida]|uniref:Alpha/beta hydrolase n=1 Tax=Phanerochaete sordida TaxID=48140 RepID=A0A9P3GMM1_9APHY|nr:alpha/beta hydrolase [Phanerochaete sordida]
MNKNTEHEGSVQAQHTRPKRGKKFWSHALLLSVIGFVLWKLFVGLVKTEGIILGVDHHCVSSESVESVWHTVPASNVESLTWVSCYSGAQCARMMVPLDYDNPTSAQAGIAIVKIPSKLSLDDKRYRGPILFNPGGPGGSGVDLIRSVGSSLQILLGDEYDIVGFDPRGISRTTPQVVVFPDSAEGAAWRLREQNSPAPNSTVDAIARIYGNAQVYGAVANVSAQDSAPYVSTAIVARDMLNIVRAHGSEKLQYWGFSYGTILGSTFAAMFPNHVERMVIDGVADVEDYYNGSWSGALRDTDKALRMVLDGCVSAGPEACALYETTTDEIHARLTAIYTHLKRSPMPVYDDTGKNYGLIDYKVAREALFRLLAAPYSRGDGYPAMELLDALAAAERGDALPLARVARIVPTRSPFKCACPGEPAPRVANTADAKAAIACADAGPRFETLEDMEAEYSKMAELSEFADMWPIRGQCSGWKIRAAERYTGAFVANTSFPILLVGNTADPITPILHARRISKGFQNSVVLQQDSAGHCSLSATSFCTLMTIREYIRQGKLPANGTVCGILSTMFPGDVMIGQEDLEYETKAAINAWMNIRKSLEVSGFGVAPLDLEA